MPTKDHRPDRRGRHSPRHKRRGGDPPKGGGWRFVPADRAHYGDGAVVSQDPFSGAWHVYDYRSAFDPIQAPVITRPTPQEAMSAWDQYVKEHHDGHPR